MVKSCGWPHQLISCCCSQFFRFDLLLMGVVFPSSRTNSLLGNKQRLETKYIHKKNPFYLNKDEKQMMRMTPFAVDEPLEKGSVRPSVRPSSFYAVFSQHSRQVLSTYLWTGKIYSLHLLRMKKGGKFLNKFLSIYINNFNLFGPHTKG